MEATTPEGKSVALTSDGGIADRLDSFVASITDALDGLDGVDKEAVEEIEATGEDLAEEVDDLEATVEELRDDTENLAEDVEDVADHQENSALERAEDRQRISDVEDRLDAVEGCETKDTNPTPEAGKTPSTEPQTPLERVVSLPAVMAKEELTANVRRARFVASDVLDYTTSVKAGRVITSGELRRVVKAGTDAQGHSQTVDRIIEVLDGMGADAVEVVERRGERRVVFEEDAAERLDALGGDDDLDGDGHDVVTGARS